MSVEYLNPVPLHEPGKISGTLRVQRVSQRELQYVGCVDILQLIYQGGVWSNGEVDIMATSDKTIREIRKMALAAAQRLS